MCVNACKNSAVLPEELLVKTSVKLFEIICGKWLMKYTWEMLGVMLKNTVSWCVVFVFNVYTYELLFHLSSLSSLSSCSSSYLCAQEKKKKWLIQSSVCMHVCVLKSLEHFVYWFSCNFRLLVREKLVFSVLCSSCCCWGTPPAMHCRWPEASQCASGNRWYPWDLPW